MSIGAHNLRFIDAVDRTGLYTVILRGKLNILHSSTFGLLTRQYPRLGSGVSQCYNSYDMYKTDSLPALRLGEQIFGSTTDKSTVHYGLNAVRDKTRTWNSIKNSLTALPAPGKERQQWGKASGHIRIILALGQLGHIGTISRTLWLQFCRPCRDTLASL